MAFENLKKDGIRYLLGKLKDVFVQIKDSVRSVNGNLPDEDGDITVTTVPYAQNLESESSHRSEDTFIQRTSGGTASIDSGDAWLMLLKGNNVHEGYVAEELNMQVVPIERDDPITAVIDRDTFVAYVATSGTINLVYSTAWSADPANYGITVTGTPVAGDAINITYVKEERGTITVANPSKFVSTGWNLYNHTDGYAKVVKYEHGYRISGTYTSIKFATTPTGAQSDIIVTDGNFDIPSDGYVIVTGGNSSDTAIIAVWEDWTEGYDGSFMAYSKTEIDLSSVMSTNFPAGLMKAGSVVDELDLNLGQAISRVERMSYSAENLATAKNSGREYEYDENYIYLARATASVVSISVSGAVTSDDHGIEYFETTTVPVYCEILYGTNLKNKLERDVLTLSSQELNATQRVQIYGNLGIDKVARITVLPNISTLNGLKSALEGINTTLTDCQVCNFRFVPSVNFDQFLSGSTYFGTLYRYDGSTFNVNLICGYRQQNIIIARYGSGWKFTETNGKGKGTYSFNFNEQCAGYITSSAGNLHIFVPFPTNPTVSDVSFTITKLTSRGVGGYVADVITDFTGITFAGGVRPDGINLVLYKSSGTWGTNNTPVVSQLEGTYTLS